MLRGLARGGGASRGTYRQPAGAPPGLNRFRRIVLRRGEAVSSEAAFFLAARRLGRDRAE